MASSAVSSAAGVPTVDRQLSGHAPWVGVEFHAFEGCLTQQVVGGPFRELGADDDTRIDPACALDSGRRLERWSILLQFQQALEQRTPRPGVDATANLSGVTQLAILVDTHHQ